MVLQEESGRSTKVSDAYVIANRKPYYIVKSYVGMEEEEEDTAAKTGRGKRTTHFDVHPIWTRKFRRRALPWDMVGVWR